MDARIVRTLPSQKFRQEIGKLRPHAGERGDGGKQRIENGGRMASKIREGNGLCKTSRVTKRVITGRFSRPWHYFDKKPVPKRSPPVL